MERVVTFKPLGDKPRIAMTLDAAWVYRCGLKGNVNSATVSYKEFNKLGTAPGAVRGLKGTVEFWYTDLPVELGGQADVADVTLEGWQILDVAKSRDGEIPDDANPGQTTFAIVEYRLGFVDFRQQWALPLGGRLTVGLVNAGVLPGTTQSGSTTPATNPDPAYAGVPELDLVGLINACVDAMGGGIKVDPLLGAGNPAAPRDLKWFGNHPLAELDKLLELAGATAVPHADGTLSILKLQKTGDPQVGDSANPTNPPVKLPELELPSTDRRGTAVVFASFPYPTTNTVKIQGPQDDGFYFVVHDSQGQWKKLKDCDLLANTDGITVIKNNGKDIPEKYRERLLDEIFKYIQVSDGTGGSGNPNGLAPSGVQPVLSKQLLADATADDLILTGKLVIEDPKVSGQYINSGGDTRIAITQKLAGNILVAKRPLFQVTGNTHNPIADAQEPAAGDLSLTMTIPVVEFDPNGQPRPSFNYIGFALDDKGQITQLADDVVRNLRNGQSEQYRVIFIPRPELRLRQINGDPVNKEQITAAANALASGYLADASAAPTRLVSYQGFVPVTLDGLVSEVSWDQQALRTNVTCNNWFRPAGALDVAGLGRIEREALKVEAYPQQAQTESHRTAMGEAGATRPVIPLGPSGSAPLPVTTPWVVQIGAPRANAAGFYSGTLYLGKLGVDGTADLALPGNLTAGQSCEVFNLDESTDQGAATKTHRLKQNSWAAVIAMDRTNNTADPGEDDNSEYLAIVRGGVGDDASPTVIDPPLTQTIADNTAWYRAGQPPTQGLAQGTGGPLDLYICTRPGVDAANKQLIAFQRKLSIDANGCIYALSGEEKIVLDTGANCS